MRRNSRTQSLFLLHMAGDWHPEHETANPSPRPHMMRTMLVSNLAVQERFANGTFYQTIGFGFGWRLY